MSQTVIKVENLSKQYRLGTVGTGTLSHDLNRWWHKVRGKKDPYLKIGESNDRASKGGSEYVWALKDINFEVKQGEVLGIIGKNGAGKSTLLKILSKVTGPTTGSIKAKGRIASLLEVGTGFHPELTGRENIYLNGTILGMTKREVDKKLDEIVDFAGVARYIDTPVKRYSSGMTVRLGFAVAAHLEPEILVVDEVLAVGDAEFQKKAIGKMQEVSHEGGRTVLFVSHNMASVKSICTKATLLENGSVSYSGMASEVVKYYLTGGEKAALTKRYSGLEIHEGVKLFSVSIRDLENETEGFDEFSQLEVAIVTEVVENYIHKYHYTLVFKGGDGNVLFTSSHKRTGLSIKGGLQTLICQIDKGFLNTGEYYVDCYLILDSKVTVFKDKDVLVFNITTGERNLGGWMNREPGLIKPNFKWVQE